MSKVKLTKEHLEQAQGVNGIFSKQQLKILGITRFYKGWKKDMIGKEFEQEDIDTLIKLKKTEPKPFSNFY